VRLSQLLHRDLPVDPEITGVTADSRRVGPGVLFAALPGVARDGADFAPQAVAAGAAAVLCSRDLPGLGVPVIASADPRRAYALAASAFHGRQPEVVVAVTGTNGKTSVAGFRRQIAAASGRLSASMGTLGLLVSGPGREDLALTPPGLTTPDAGDVAALLADLADRGVTDLALEASSHGIDQRRLDGVRPRPGGQVLTLEHAGRTWRVDLPLAGAFQAMNALAAAGLGLAIGETPEEIFAALEQLKGAPGRLQHVGSGPRGGEAYVDYAHTPDGLETVLKALRPHASGRLILVFGAGGDRDRTKRPLMGELAARLADLAIVTDDNPRSEDPAAIRAEVRAGGAGLADIGDRREAIRTAVSELREGDILVVAGKGHEQGQTLAGVVHPFDDVSETRAALEGRS